MAAVVLEIGNSLVRAGIAGESKPRINIKFDKIRGGCGIGTKYASGLRSQYLATVEFIAKLFTFLLPVKPRECSIIILEHVFESRLYRDVLFTVLLREFQVNAVTFQPDILMPALATGNTTAVIVDIGSAETRCICITLGKPMLRTLSVGQYGVATCAALLASQKTLDIEVAQKELFVPTVELIPNAVLCWWEDIARLIQSCADQAPIDFRKSIIGNLVFCGGGSNASGIQEGVRAALALIANDDATLMPTRYSSLQCSSPTNASELVWVGGSLCGASKGLRYVNQQDIHNFESHDTALLRAPDWMSTAKMDWIFFAPKSNNS